MALTNQRVIPIVLVVVALGLVAARVVVSLTKRAPSKGSGVQWLNEREVLYTAWRDSHPQPLVTTGGHGPGCDGDSCAV